MDANTLSRLIQIANWFKAIREGEDYRFPNQIFAYLLQYYFNEGGTGLGLTIETQDLEGAYPEEVYYDILVIYGADADESLCIPVPLVDSWVVICLYKQGVIRVDREEHRRCLEEAAPGERELLLQELFALVSEDELAAAGKKFLEAAPAPLT